VLLPLLLATALAPPPAVPRAVETAVSRPDVRVEVVDYRPAVAPGCRIDGARVRGEVRGSGAVTVDLEGRDARGASCTGWALARVRVRGRVPVAARTLAAGDRLDGAIAFEERELFAEERPLAAVPPGAVAARPIAAGTVLTPNRIRTAGPRPGSPVPVVVARGAFTVETTGTLVACSGGRDCALLPAGKRLAGTLRDGKLYVEVP
jgi:hypothetical protein